MEIIIPKFPRGFKKSAIYKIVFDDKWIYIGSSTKLKSRFARWQSCFKGTVRLKSINIRSILPTTKRIEISIMEWVGSVHLLRDIETSYIKQEWNNPFLLNRCPDAKSPKGMRPYFGYIKPIQYKKSTNIQNLERIKKKPVAVFDKKNNLIEIVPSKTELERKFKIKHEDVSAILSGKRGQPRKVTLKSIGDNGEFIDAVLFVRKKPLYIHQPNKRKPVNQIDMDGNIVAVFSHCREAAKAMGCTNELIHRVLKNKKGYPRAKGFYWKYA